MQNDQYLHSVCRLYCRNSYKEESLENNKTKTILLFFFGDCFYANYGSVVLLKYYYLHTITPSILVHKFSNTYEQFMVNYSSLLQGETCAWLNYVIFSVECQFVIKIVCRLFYI